MTRHAILICAMLPLFACTTTAPPEPARSASAPGSAYQGLSCDEMAAQSKSAASDLAWARRMQQQTFSSDTTSNVTLSMPFGGSGGSSAGPHIGRAKSEQASLRDAMDAKGCASR